MIDALSGEVGTNSDFTLVRLTTNGVLDTSFGGGDGIVYTDLSSSRDIIYSIFIQPDGKIVVSGDSRISSPSAYVFAAARYNSDGSLDQSFGDQGFTKIQCGSACFSTSMAVQPDGKIIIGGHGNGTMYLTRLKSNGTIDSTFSQNGIMSHHMGFFDSRIHDIAVQPDGKIVATGYIAFEGGGANESYFIARYLPNGVLDTSFAINGVLHDKFNGSNSKGNSIALQPDGKIVIGAYSASKWCLARYHSDGMLDPAFDFDGKISTQIPQRYAGLRALAIQPDGKIISTGSSTATNSNGEFTTVRYNSDGSLDTSFGDAGIKITVIATGGAKDYANALAIQSDGKIIAVGGAENNFNQYGIGVVRYLTNLSVGINSNPVLCFGGNSGSATVTPFGGTSPYTYLWSNGQTTASATNLTTGTYTVTVTGSGASGTATGSVTITQPPALTITAAVSGALTCLQPSVSATANVGGGKPGYTFLWSNAASGPTATFSTPGTYHVTVTDANGCTRSSSVTVVNGDITPPTAIVAPGGTLTCSITQLALDGTGSSLGGAYSYQWRTPDGNIVSGGNTLSPTVNDCGTYTLLVTRNSNGCTASASTTVTCDMATPNIVVGSPSPLTCANLSVTLNGSSSTSGVSFLWTGPNGYSSTDPNPTIDTPGSYMLLVSNPANSCSSFTTLEVHQNTAPPTASIALPNTLNCNNSAVQLDATASSQGPAFTYLWISSDGILASGETTLTPLATAAGTYTLQVTNTENGCTSTASTSVVQHSAVLTSISASTSVACNGGSNGAATAAASGGDGAYSYVWSNNATSPSITGLSAGLYLVTATDGEGCTSTSSITITQPDPLLANATATGETFLDAGNGTATVAPTGGTAGYTYSWSNGQSTATISSLAPGIYTVTVYDSNGCSSVQELNVAGYICALSASVSGTNIDCFGNSSGLATASLSGGQLPYTYLWSNGATTATINNLAAGMYAVTATDDAGCTSTGSIALTQPLPLSASVGNIQNVLCPGDMTGLATVNTNGGTAPYNYSGNLNNLGVGNYSVTVTDANGCATLVSFSILATDSEAPVMVCPANMVVCGAGIVDYDAPIISDNCSGNIASSLTIGLPSGAQFDEGATLQIFQSTDANGNSSTCAFTIVVQPNPAVVLDGVVHDQNGQGTGAIAVTGSGGGGNLTYSWTKNGQFFASLEDLSGLTEGTYSLVVTDGNGCSAALGPVQVSNTVGINDPSESIAINLFPNPCINAFQLEVSGAAITAANIYDIQGKLIYALQPMEWQGKVDTGRLSNGIYYLRLWMEAGQVFALKFVKSE